MKPRSTENIERKILIMSFLIGLFFVAVEFITAIYTHSNSMLMDATFDATELIVIVPDDENEKGYQDREKRLLILLDFHVRNHNATYIFVIVGGRNKLYLIELSRQERRC